MHRPPFGELSGQHAPLAATFEQVHRCRLGPLACILQQWLELFELLATDVTRVLVSYPSIVGEEKDYEQALKRRNTQSTSIN